MKINELISDFKIFTTNDEKRMLESLTSVRLLSSFSERDQCIIEQLIRKSLVIKIGSENPQVVANDDI